MFYNILALLIIFNNRKFILFYGLITINYKFLRISFKRYNINLKTYLNNKTIKLNKRWKIKKFVKQKMQIHIKLI